MSVCKSSIHLTHCCSVQSNTPRNLLEFKLDEIRYGTKVAKYISPLSVDTIVTYLPRQSCIRRTTSNHADVYIYLYNIV